MGKVLKIRLNINTILFLVMLYPVILFFPNLFGKEVFYLTTPYFFLIFLLLIGIIILKGMFTLNRNYKLIIFLILVVLYNFSSLRYSLPVFFIAYIFLLQIVLNTVRKDEINMKIVELFFYFFILISIPFIFLPQGWNLVGRFVGFIGSPTVYAGIMATMFSIVAKKWELKTWKFAITFIIIGYLIFISKTRLLLIFLVVFPLIKYLLANRMWFTKKRIYVIFLITTISIYPLYGVVTNMFPSLVSIRYEEGSKDKSFGLRLYLNEKLSEDYKDGTITQKLFGKGNEYSRNLVKSEFNADIFPHNDFWRIITDWGIIGFLLFMCFLYILAVKNIDTFYISLIYILLFYSNMVFNIFMMSLLIIFYYNNRKMPVKNEIQN